MKKALGVGFILARRTPCGVSARRGRRFRSDRSLDSGRQWTHTYRLKSLSDAVGQLSELCRTLSDAVGTLSDSVGPGLRAGLCRYRPSIPGVRVPRYMRASALPRFLGRCVGLDVALSAARETKSVGISFCRIRACLFPTFYLVTRARLRGTCSALDCYHMRRRCHCGPSGFR